MGLNFQKKEFLLWKPNHLSKHLIFSAILILQLKNWYVGEIWVVDAKYL